MLTYDEVVVLDRSLRSTRVLTVYVDAGATDATGRPAWRARLDAQVDEWRRSRLVASAPHPEREEFQRCVEHLEQLLRRPLAGAVRGGAWAIFITPDDVRHASVMPVSMPTMVTWGKGIHVSPVLRVLKELRAAVIAIVDSRGARLLRYQAATLRQLNVLHPQRYGQPLARIGRSSRARRDPETSCATGTDLAEGDLRVGRMGMMLELADSAREVAGVDGWILIGGATMAIRDVLSMLSASEQARAIALPRLTMKSTMADIKRAAVQGSTILRGRQDAASARGILDLAAIHGRGVTGVEPTRRALDWRAVQRLFMTPGFIERHGTGADGAARAAFDQGAYVEIVAGAGADVLDRAAEGIGALLRYAAWVDRLPPDAPHGSLTSRPLWAS